MWPRRCAAVQTPYHVLLHRVLCRVLLCSGQQSGGGIAACVGKQLSGVWTAGKVWSKEL